jgi:hypothetical protein
MTGKAARSAVVFGYRCGGREGWSWRVGGKTSRLQHHQAIAVAVAATRVADLLPNREERRGT